MTSGLNSSLKRTPRLYGSRNSDKREREYFTHDELNRLLAAAKKARHADKYYSLLLLMFRHGLRAEEASSLTWEDIDWSTERIHIKRVKGGLEQTHPLDKEEVRYLKRLYKNRSKNLKYVFVTQKGGAYTGQGIWDVYKNLGIKANLPFPIHPHMMRHTCAYMLASKTGDALLVKDYLGQKDIKSALHYLNLTGERFNRLGNWWE